MIEQETEKREKFGYWRGMVDNKLEKLEESVGDNRRKLIRIEEKIDLLNSSVGISTGKSDFISWEFIRNKFMVPLILALITFVLFTVLPAVLVVIYLLPDIVETIK